MFMIKRWWRKLTVRLFFNADHSPKRCPDCWETSFNEYTKDSIEGTVCEFSVECTHCKQRVGYWAYGYYDPCFEAGYVGVNI